MAIYRRVPFAPEAVGAIVIMRALEAEGMSITARTVAADLAELRAAGLIVGERGVFSRHVETPCPCCGRAFV